MKKVLLTKSTGAVTCIKITSPDNSRANPAYAALFQALLNIPEKHVHQRVMDAINGTIPASMGHTICPNCKYSFSDQTATLAKVNACTQTENWLNAATKNCDDKDVCTVKPLAVHGDSGQNSTVPSDDSRDLNSPTAIAQEQEPIGSTSENIAIRSVAAEPVRRKRKRKLCLPQVVKTSHAQLAQSQLQPKMKKRKAESKSSNKERPNNTCNKRVRSNSEDALLANIDPSVLEALITQPEPENLQKHIYRTMAQEVLEANTTTEGLLSLHRAVIDNEPYKLQRQIFVWKNMKKCDLNTLLTDEDQDCLQLAVVNNCFPKIIDILLTAGVSPNVTDNQSNTCIHLAVLNEIDLKSLRTLMKKIDLTILMKLNDDGYTPLQVAVRYDCYRHAEVMLDTLDECLLGKALYGRPVRANDTFTDFSIFYENACKQLEMKFNNATSGVAQPKLKKRLLEAGDMKSGNTALFFAIENKFEHFVYFLLAHLTDPRVENHSGQDAKSYYSEFGRSLGLSLKVGNAMESVVQLMHHNP